MAVTLLLRALLVPLVATACSAAVAAGAQPASPAAMAAMAAAAAAAAPGSEAPRRFESEALGLKITLPDGWDVRTGSDPVVVTARSGAKGMTVVATRRPESPEGKGLEPAELSAFWSAFLRELPGAGPDAQPSGQGEATLSGEPGRFAWIRVAPPPGDPSPALMGYSVTGARGGLLVRISLVAPQPEYRAARQAFDAAVKSFAFTR